jgi:hypothetical protein
MAPGWQLLQSLHDEFWVNPDPPTLTTPFPATLRRSATVPAMTFGDLTHTLSGSTVWDVRVGRLLYSQVNAPSTGSMTTPPCYFGRSIRTISEFSRERPNTMVFPSGATSNVRNGP